ncbi:MAG: LPS-assembly protein LptD, partial [Alphaproteobacteria bacterium]
PFTAGPTFYHGTAGSVVRATKEIAWQNKFISPQGLVLQPFAYARGDVFGLASTSAAPTLTTDSFAFRAMPAGGIDARLPILVQGANSTHIIEPRAQLIVRPDEMRAGTLPNNDAQSLVFDDTNLFVHDKFSGNDRMEGGGRLNVGLQYSSNFANGASISGTIGQSYHLFGTNPYATADIANVGPGSGLETAISDVVAGASVDTGLGPRFAARARLDAKTFLLKRAELTATMALGAVTTSTSFVFLKANPNTGITADSSVIRAAASVNLSNNWRAYGTVTFDAAKAAIASDSFGIAYDDESATVSLSYSETLPNYTDLTGNRWFHIRVSLRTLGHTGLSTNLDRISN